MLKFFSVHSHNSIFQFIVCILLRRLTDIQEQLTELQQEFDVSKEECLGHQKVIQELKLNLEEVCVLLKIFSKR